MVSKNNLKNKLIQDAKRVPHYGIRKFSIGVASVLIGTTLYFGMTAQADSTTTVIPQSTDETSQVVGNTNHQTEANSSNSTTLSGTDTNADSKAQTASQTTNNSQVTNDQSVQPATNTAESNTESTQGSAANDNSSTTTQLNLSQLGG